MRIWLSLIVGLFFVVLLWGFRPELVTQSLSHIPASQPTLMTAQPVPGEVARVFLLPTALQRLSTLIVPMELPAAGASGYRLVALGYCSAANDMTGDAVGIALPTSWAPAATAALSSQDCQLTLAQLAANANDALRGSNTVGHAVALRIRLSWVPWTLKFQVIEANDGTSPVPRLLSDEPFLSLRTDMLSVSDISALHATVAFQRKHVTVRMFESPGSAVQSGAEASATDSSADALFVVKFEYLTRIIASHPQSFSLDNSGNPLSIQVAFSKIAPSSVSGGVAINGSVTVPSFPPAPFQVSLRPNAGDLVYQTIDLQAPAKPCATIQDPLTRIGCRGENTIMRQLVDTRSAQLQAQAVDQPFRPVSPSQLMRLDLRGQRHLLQFETQSVSADASWIMFQTHPILTKDTP